VRSGLEQDLQITKVKLSRAESSRSGLEQSVEAKGKENVELARICDELVLQIEKMSTN
jgi:hypothetical protein